MNISDLINQYYPPGTLSHEVLMRHSIRVARAAVRIAERVPHLNPDTGFIEEAAMLHDIGIFYTRSPQFGCHGVFPYICHGYLGRELLERHGLPDHARVCENHVGVGLTASDIHLYQLPIPVRDMIPMTVEEQVICYADTFFSKTPPPVGTRRNAAEVIGSLERYGRDKVETFTKWFERFGEPEECDDAEPVSILPHLSCDSRK